MMLDWIQEVYENKKDSAIDEYKIFHLYQDKKGLMSM